MFIKGTPPTVTFEALHQNLVKIAASAASPVDYPVPVSNLVQQTYRPTVIKKATYSDKGGWNSKLS